MEFSSFRGLIRLTGRELDFETREEIDHRGEIWDYANCFFQLVLFNEYIKFGFESHQIF